MTPTPDPLPLGKLPPELLAQLLAQAPVSDERVLVGPGVGFDCAVVDLGPTLLVLKSDPITFATAEIGRYLVQVNANDIATTGATPRWLLVTLLLPEGKTTAALAAEISQQIYTACREMGVSVLGGHSEVTYALTRPIAIGTMIGEVTRDRLVTPAGARPGNRLLLTKGVPIEATAILAREFADRLTAVLSPAELAQAQDFLVNPGISVLREAEIALQAGRVTAMHDPTEGGLAAALWELAEASGRSLLVEPAAVPVPPLAGRICRALGLDPLAAIASGALLLAVAADDSAAICQALQAAGIGCAEIGEVIEGEAAVWMVTGNGRQLLPRPAQDEIARAYTLLTDWSNLQDCSSLGC
jgi:hydrogenase expression/formation protein HypE